jgi:hypothetical protein
VNEPSARTGNRKLLDDRKEHQNIAVELVTDVFLLEEAPVKRPG